MSILTIKPDLPYQIHAGPLHLGHLTFTLNHTHEVIFIDSMIRIHFEMARKLSEIVEQAKI